MERLQAGEFVDIGRGPQEVRFVNAKHLGDVANDFITYEIAQPGGGTPLQTVAHTYIESFPEHRKELARSKARLAALCGLAGAP